MSVQASVEAKTSFVGTLVRRQYKPGQGHAQLLFKNGENLQLSLSKNIKSVTSLVVGETYRVQGVLKTIGARQCLMDATALPYTSRKSRNLRLITFVAFGILLLSSGAVFTTRHLHAQNTSASAAGTVQMKSASNTQKNEQTTSAPSAAVTPATSTAAPVPTASPSTTTTSRPTSSTTKKTTTNVPTVSSSTQPAAAPATTTVQTQADTSTPTDSGPTDTTGTPTGTDSPDGTTPTSDQPPADPAP